PDAIRATRSGTMHISAGEAMLFVHQYWPPGGRVSPRAIERSTPSTAATVPPSVANSTRSPATDSSEAVIALLLSPDRVALHAARIGPGLQHDAFRGLFAGAGGQAAARPGLADADAVAARRQLAPRRFRHPPFEGQRAGGGGARVERARRVAVVELRAVDRLLQIHAVMDVVQEELGRPLVLAVAAGGAER